MLDGHSAGSDEGAAKRREDNAQIHESAKRLCRQSESEEPGVPPAPSSSLDPLNPPLSAEEYDDLERDRCVSAPYPRHPRHAQVVFLGYLLPTFILHLTHSHHACRSKYLLYFAALRKACRHLAQRRASQQTSATASQRAINEPLTILVLGAGHGRLVTLAIEVCALCILFVLYSCILLDNPVHLRTQTCIHTHLHFV